MPPVRKIDLLPADIRRELDERAAAAGWGDVRGLSAWLQDQGYEIGKTAVGEHVQALRAEYAATMREIRATVELTRLMVDADPDEQASLHEVINRMGGVALMRNLKDLAEAKDLDAEVRIPLIAKAMQANTQAQRGAVYSRRWSAEQRKAAEDAAREAARAAGLDDATAERIASGVQIYLPDNQRRGAGAGG